MLGSGRDGKGEAKMDDRAVISRFVTHLGRQRGYAKLVVNRWPVIADSVDCGFTITLNFGAKTGMDWVGQGSNQGIMSDIVESNCSTRFQVLQ